MKMAVKSRTILFACVLVIFSCTSENIDETPQVETFNVQELETQLHAMVNSHRNSIGQSTLEFNSIAYAYANDHTDYMIAKGSLSHDNFNSRASKISSETEAKEVAENVAKAYPTAEAALEGWLNSAPHKTNIEGDFTHTAISVKKTANGDIYYTQIFFR